MNDGRAELSRFRAVTLVKHSPGAPVTKPEGEPSNPLEPRLNLKVGAEFVQHAAALVRPAIGLAIATAR